MSADLRSRRNADERFDAKWQRLPNGCHRWLASLTGTGYGKFLVKGRLVAAHRYAYERIYGPVPEQLVLDHLCRNRWCVNPDHLEVVTHQVNLARGQSPAAIAHRRGMCGRGHPYTVRNGRNFCAVCAAERERRRTARRKAERQRRGVKEPATHCRNGHEFTPENTVWVRRRDGSVTRYCRICKNATWRRMNERRRR